MFHYVYGELLQWVLSPRMRWLLHYLDNFNSSVWDNVRLRGVNTMGSISEDEVVVTLVSLDNSNSSLWDKLRLRLDKLFISSWVTTTLGVNSAVDTFRNDAVDSSCKCKSCDVQRCIIAGTRT